ncbi:hypothetical protein BC936DRAFT_142183 [Jimgerdemannia flammicorona]|uniref:Uncharacterized protein n=1 Tax=Jimgerdemannia flammicorona TaxID=994334 RepID=A0A433DFF6_9FUNG|nr:hypothetical protein BC936DRAFT_142183 [Jimgerdemannia flammicorona]
MAVANIWESIDVLQRRGKLSEELFSLHFDGFTELIQSRKKQSTHESEEDSQERQGDEDIDTIQGIGNLVDEVEDSGHEDSEAEFREREKVVNSREDDDDTGWREDSEMDDSEDADRHTEKQTKFTCSGFTEEELDEINKENTNDLPDLKPELLDFIYTFAKTSTAEIREELNQPHARLGKAYDPTIDYVYDHIKSTVADWVRLLEKTPNPLALNMPEQWYRANLWRSIDIAFGDIPYVFVVGGERAGIATAERKNRHRTLGNEVSMLRKQIGKKGDGFVRSLGSRPTDWAASEAGAHWEGEKGTKLLKEGGFSLPRQLKDIFSTLARRVNFDKDKIRQLNVPGFIHADAIIIKGNLDNPRGYVCR